jgi:hypothetical protein
MGLTFCHRWVGETSGREMNKFDVSCDALGCFHGGLSRPDRENYWPSLLEELRRQEVSLRMAIIETSCERMREIYGPHCCRDTKWS